jgi:hypothetical protein
MVRRVLLALLVVLGCVLAVAAPAGAVGSRHTVTAQDVYLRSYPESWFIGTLYQGSTFDVQGEQSGYYWGYAFGNFDGCAWVLASALTTGTGTANAPSCGLSGRLPLGDSAHTPAAGIDTNGDGVPDRLTAPYQVVCQSAGLYGNYRGGAHHDFRFTLGPGTPVGWRYTTGDGRSAAIRYDAGDTWAFIPRECIAPR